MSNLKFWNTTIHDRSYTSSSQPGGCNLNIYDIFFALHLILGGNIWTCVDVMTFFLILGGNLNICGHDDRFFLFFT